MILFRAFNHVIIPNATHQAVTKFRYQVAAGGNAELSESDMRRLKNNLLDNGRFSCHDWEFPQTEDQIIARDRTPGIRHHVVLTNSADHCKRILRILIDFIHPGVFRLQDAEIIPAERDGR
jgi:hypothetical protein